MSSCIQYFFLKLKKLLRNSDYTLEKCRLDASAAESAAADVTPANENPTTSSTEDVSAASTQPAKTPDLHTAEYLASAVQKNLNVSSTNGGANDHSRDDLVNLVLYFTLLYHQIRLLLATRHLIVTPPKNTDEYKWDTNSRFCLNHLLKANQEQLAHPWPELLPLQPTVN